MTSAQIRPAQPGDVPQIYALIRDLADHHGEGHSVRTTRADLHDSLFSGSKLDQQDPGVFCDVVDVAADGFHEVVGIAIWYITYSTWEGEHGIHLEDLIVRPEYRGHGFGTGLLSHLARVCVRRGLARLEWSVAADNQAAIDFYLAHGAVPKHEWTEFRVDGQNLIELGRMGGSDQGSTG
jgi:ribosomal protein S18 acetylase RimI-like enzyme